MTVVSIQMKFHFVPLVVIVHFTVCSLCCLHSFLLSLVVLVESVLGNTRIPIQSSRLVLMIHVV